MKNHHHQQMISCGNLVVQVQLRKLFDGSARSDDDLRKNCAMVMIFSPSFTFSLQILQVVV